MCAGLIPGVNIKTRPRALMLFSIMTINETLFSVYAAIASNQQIDAIAVRDKLMDYAIPPLSPTAKKDEETKKMLAVLNKIAPGAQEKKPNE